MTPRLHLRLHLLLLSIIPCVTGAVAESLHFKPADHALGDVHPFFHDGKCWLYYLKPGKYEAALVQSRDLLHWTALPVTHDATGPDEWMAPYYVLGVLRDDGAGVYRSFFGHAQGRMASSVSTDLLHWSCAAKEFHVPPGDYYQRRRDPYVFWIPERREYGCVMTTWMKGRPKETCGAVSLALSPDLKRWTDHGPILDPGNIGEPECPQMFTLNKKWHLLASIYDRAVGAPTYWSSDSPLGPWTGKPRPLDGKDLCAAQIGLDGDKLVLFGWIPLAPARPGKQTWGGHLALPREVIESAPGVLGTRLCARIAHDLALLPKQTHSDVMVKGGNVTIDGGWSRPLVEFTCALPEQGEGLRLRFAPLGEVRIQRQRLAVLDAAGECWSELPVDLPADQQVPVQVLVEGNIVEVFAAGRYSLAARVPKIDGRLGLSFGSDDNPVVVFGLRTCEWALPKERPPD